MKRRCNVTIVPLAYASSKPAGRKKTSSAKVEKNITRAAAWCVCSWDTPQLPYDEVKQLATEHMKGTK